MLLILFHVTLVLGIAALAQSLGFNNRTASLIAILYALEFVVPVLRHAICVRVDGHYSGRVDTRCLCSGDPLAVRGRDGPHGVC